MQPRISIIQPSVHSSVTLFFICKNAESIESRGETPARYTYMGWWRGWMMTRGNTSNIWPPILSLDNFFCVFFPLWKVRWADQSCTFIPRLRIWGPSIREWRKPKNFSISQTITNTDATGELSDMKAPLAFVLFQEYTFLFKGISPFP